MKEAISKAHVSTLFSLPTFFQNQPMKVKAIKKSIVSYFKVSANQQILWSHSNHFCIYKKSAKPTTFSHFMSCPLVKLLQGGQKGLERDSPYLLPPTPFKISFLKPSGCANLLIQKMSSRNKTVFLCFSGQSNPLKERMP